MEADYNDNYLTSTYMDTTDATSITVSFWYRYSSLETSDDAYIQFWNGEEYVNIGDLTEGGAGQWLPVTPTAQEEDDPGYFRSDFRIRFSNDFDYYNDKLWVDNVLVTKSIDEDEVTLLNDGFETDPSPTITPYDDDDPIVVAPRQKVLLTFAAENPESTSWRWGDSNYPSSQGGLPEGLWYGNTPEGGTVMTSLAFTLESEPEHTYAQSLPFQALVLNGNGDD